MEFDPPTRKRNQQLAGGTLLCSLLFTLTLSCQSKSPGPVSILPVGQPTLANQLIAGFYGADGNDWRWTSRQFAVVLQPPSAAEKSGAKLQVKLYIPEAEIKTLGPMTLSAEVGEYSLASKTFSKPGSWVYERDIPSALIPHGAVLPIVFDLDRALAPWQADGRELGVVVSEVSLQ